MGLGLHTQFAKLHPTESTKQPSVSCVGHPSKLVTVPKKVGNRKHPKNIRSDGFTELLSGSTFQIRSIFDTSGNTYELMTQTVEYGLCGFRKTPLRGQSGVIHQGNSRGILSLGERHNLDQVPARIGRVGCLRNAEVAYQMGIKSTGMTLDRR